MPTAKIQTQIHPGHYVVIKELLVADPLLDIIDSFPTVEQHNQQVGAYLCLLGENFFEFIQSITAPTSAANLSATQLTQLWNGEIDLQTTFAESKPSLPVLRVALLQAIIDTLHERFPERRTTQPILDSFSNLNGMARIRALFKQYITKTTPGSLERYKLALEILLEKENLDLSSHEVSEADITLTAGFAPGDFSHLDLSYLDLRRDDGQDGGFQGLILHHSNCDGSDWRGLSLVDADFTNCSLRGANLSSLSNHESINLSQADIEGSYFGDDYITDRRAKNYTQISQTNEQLTAFQPQLRQKIMAEKLQLAEIKNFNTFKTAYFSDYHSSFFKNPRSAMKVMIENDLIHTMAEVSQYADEHPNTRTARVYSALELVTVDDSAELEASLSTCQKQ